MHLVPDAVERHAALQQARHQRVVPVLLAAALGAVVVDEEGDRAVGGRVRVHLVERLVGVAEGQVDELLAEHVVPGAAAHAVLVGGAVVDHLVDDVPGHEWVRLDPKRPQPSARYSATEKMWVRIRSRRIS